MKSIQRARLVVVADSDHGLVLAERLRRMDVAQVTEVAGHEEARGLCRAGAADACIVLLDDTAPDAKPTAETVAPGRGSGVPSLMMAPSVSPYMRKAARGLYGGGSRLHRTSDALSPHRRGAAKAARGPPPVAHAEQPERAGPRFSPPGRRFCQSNSALTVLFRSRWRC